MSPAPGWLASSWIVVGCLISITDATARREHCYPLWKSLTKKLGFAPSGQRVQDLLVRHKSRYSSVFVGYVIIICYLHKKLCCSSDVLPASTRTCLEVRWLSHFSCCGLTLRGKGYCCFVCYCYCC
ncbi:hypothetical protein PF008_g16483 [Phytophthora fragariae]|uniref:Secreted protein n=1 Tax=Phytophthora fragariae TaxID=53985 RepID=A0A6G0RB09_9STRA|nr:hypothetical protein PF008_g16483 [Phytophthora fragariae]